MWAILALVISALAATASVGLRHRVEARNKATALCMEAEVLRDAAAASGQSFAEALARAKDHGLTGVVASEETIGDLAGSGRLSLSPKAGGGVEISGSREALDRVRWGLATRFPATGRVPYAFRGEVVEVAGIGDSTLRAVSLGIDPGAAHAATTAGLLVVARHANAAGTTPSSIASILEDSVRKGAQVLLPMGDQVLGQRDLVRTTADQLKRLGMQYATPEFAKISGDAKLSALMQERLIRVHSIQAAEIDRSTPEEVVERFVKAAKERNIRMLLLRPLSAASADPLAALCETLDRIRGRLAREHVAVGVPKPFVDSNVPLPLFLLIGLSVGTVVYWVATALWLGRPGHWIGGLSMLAVVGLSAIGSGRPLAALAAALAYPVAAYLCLDAQERQNLILHYLLVSAVSLAGGLCVAGLLNGLPYFTRVDQFVAVKLAHFAPIVVVAWLLLRSRMELKAFVRSPVGWGALFLTLLAFAALGLMLARTGNDNPAAVSGLEIRLRGILDAVLYTRPRTKEFLIGHPALVLGLYLWLVSARRFGNEKHTMEVAGAALLSVGAIGQTSIVNTLCHLHTPVVLSLARIATGLAVGLAFGLALIAILRPTVLKEPA